MSPTDNIQSIKRCIENKTGVPLHDQRLVFEGKQLVDNRCIGDYGVQQYSTLHLLLRLRGGAANAEEVKAMFGMMENQVNELRSQNLILNKKLKKEQQKNQSAMADLKTSQEKMQSLQN